MIREEPRWKRRPWLSWVIRFTVFLVPVLAAAGVAVLAGRAFPSPETFPGILVWWLGLIAIVVGVLVLIDRLVGRMLPLAALMRLTLAFPDRAPSRAQVLRTSGSIRGLEQKLEAASAAGEMEVADAAEHILSLAAALNEHDRLTRGHGERVRVFADMIADEMGIPESDQDRLRWMALLHDVGKLAVDREILNSPDLPTEEQWQELRRHPEEGAKLIAPIREWLGPWADTVEQHHERYDGQGYPRGLAGDEIALGARIVSVADAYDAITAARSYKAAISAEAARRELAESAGSHFDPKVVRALMNVSLGKLRVAIGPGAWFAQIPVLGVLERFSRQAGVVGATVALVAALFAGGVITAPSATAGDVAAAGVSADASVGGAGTDADDAGGGNPAAAAESNWNTSSTMVDPAASTTSTSPSTTTTLPQPTTTTTPRAASTTTSSSPSLSSTTTSTPQRPPVAGDDSATTLEDTPVEIAVLSNDSDPDGDPLTIVAFDGTSSQGGTVACTATSCTYTPPPDYFEGVVKPDDSFGYRVSDGTGQLATGRVSIEITGVNDAPTATDDLVTIQAGVFTDLQVLLNDFDVEQAGLEISAVDATGVSGTISWLAGLNTIFYTAPATPTTDVFTYEIVDAGGLTAIASVTVVVTP